LIFNQQIRWVVLLGIQPLIERVGEHHWLRKLFEVNLDERLIRGIHVEVEELLLDGLSAELVHPGLLALNEIRLWSLIEVNALQERVDLGERFVFLKEPWSLRRDVNIDLFCRPEE
jgi:hypothetical protein